MRRSGGHPAPAATSAPAARSAIGPIALRLGPSHNGGAPRSQATSPCGRALFRKAKCADLENVQRRQRLPPAGRYEIGPIALRLGPSHNGGHPGAKRDALVGERYFAKRNAPIWRAASAGSDFSSGRALRDRPNRFAIRAFPQRSRGRSKFMEFSATGSGSWAGGRGRRTTRRRRGKWAP